MCQIPVDGKFILSAVIDLQIMRRARARACARVATRPSNEGYLTSSAFGVFQVFFVRSGT